MKKKLHNIYKQAKFLSSFQKIIENEKSHLGKMVLQENYISIKLQSTIFLSDMFSFFSMCSNEILYKGTGLEDEIMYDKYSEKPTVIPLPNRKNLSQLPLGKLINIFEGTLINTLKTGILVIKKLKKYNKDRVRLTHKILYEYVSRKNIEIDARDVYKNGQEIIKLLNKIFKILEENEKRFFLNTHKK